MCGCNRNNNANNAKRYNPAPAARKTVAGFSKRPQNVTPNGAKKTPNNSPNPINQNGNNAEIIRKALMQKNRNKNLNKKFFT